MAKLSPVFNDQSVDVNGDPRVGAKLFTYAAGSIGTKVPTYTDSAGTVPQTNPIILNADGYPTLGPIWITEGTMVKFVLAPPTDTDPPTSPIRTIDNISGVNDSATTISQWTASGTTPTYVSANSFTLSGDQTSAFQIGRREQFTTSGGTVYGNILTSAYTTLTTVTMQMDGASVLDAGLSVVNHSILLTSPLAEPSLKTQSFGMGSTYGNYSILGAKGVTVASAATTPIFASTDGNTVDISGSFSGVTSLGSTGLTPGYTIQGTILGSPTFTPSANLVLNGGGGSITANPGDKYEAYCDSTTVVTMTITRFNGNSIVPSSPPQRQTVLSGPVDSSGYSAFVGATGTTTVTATGTLVATAAAGGQNNYTGSITNPSWTGLSTNGTYYAYLEISANGVVTTGAVQVLPVTQWGGTYSITNNQHTFNVQEMTMKAGNGATATQVYRVFVGEFIVSANVVASIKWYQLYNRYLSPAATFPANATVTTLNSNVGESFNMKSSLQAIFTTASNGYSIGDTLEITAGNGTAYLPNMPWFTRNQTGFTTGSLAGRSLGVFNKATGAVEDVTVANCQYRVCVLRNW